MAELGHGTGVLSIGVVTVGEIRSVAFSADVDVAVSRSTDSKFTKYFPTSVSSGAIALSLFLNSSNYASFIEAIKTKNTTQWVISFGLNVFQCSGFVQSMTVTSSFDNAIAMDIVIKMTGEFSD